MSCLGLRASMWSLLQRPHLMGPTLLLAFRPKAPAGRELVIAGAVGLFPIVSCLLLESLGNPSIQLYLGLSLGAVSSWGMRVLFLAGLWTCFQKVFLRFLRQS